MIQMKIYELGILRTTYVKYFNFFVCFGFSLGSFKELMLKNFRCSDFQKSDCSGSFVFDLTKLNFMMNIVILGEYRLLPQQFEDKSLLLHCRLA